MREGFWWCFSGVVGLLCVRCRASIPSFSVWSSRSQILLPCVISFPITYVALYTQHTRPVQSCTSRCSCERYWRTWNTTAKRTGGPRSGSADMITAGNIVGKSANNISSRFRGGSLVPMIHMGREFLVHPRQPAKQGKMKRFGQLRP